MPGFKNLVRPASVQLLYDGSLEGMYSCIHTCIYGKLYPDNIVPEGRADPSLLEQRYVETDLYKASRVRGSIPHHISAEGLDLVETAFYSCLNHKEMQILRFLLYGYEVGGSACRALSHPDVSPLYKAARQLGGECEKLLGFVRFSDYDGVLAAAISPKNFVLPYLAHHFVQRYSCEQFLIFDRVHKAALIYQDRSPRIVPLDDITFPEVSEREHQYRALWKQFYHTIAIKERYNPKCRMTHMPKRYWENMTEMQELLYESDSPALPQPTGRAALPEAQWDIVQMDQALNTVRKGFLGMGNR